MRGLGTSCREDVAAVAGADGPDGVVLGKWQMKRRSGFHVERAVQARLKSSLAPSVFHRRLCPCASSCAC